jgi:hypothetical protein
MKEKRGQVALEFLLTYGWAILILTVVALLLWQMGLFNISGEVDPGTSGFWGVAPYEDFAYTKEQVLMIPISNRVGANVTIMNISVTFPGMDTYTDTSPKDEMPDDSAIIAPGDTKVWSSPKSPAPPPTEFPKYTAGSTFKAFVTIAYNDSRTGEIYLSSGNMWGNVEA